MLEPSFSCCMAMITAVAALIPCGAGNSLMTSRLFVVGADANQSSPVPGLPASAVLPATQLEKTPQPSGMLGPACADEHVSPNGLQGHLSDMPLSKMSPRPSAHCLKDSISSSTQVLLIHLLTHGQTCAISI